MKTIEIAASPRSVSGKAENKQIRKSGMVPCVMYGNGEPVHFSLKMLEVDRALASANTFIYKIDLDGKSHQAILKDSQFHPTLDTVIHMDFVEISDSTPVEVSLPVKLTGTAKGVREGGRLITLIRKINVRGIPFNLPETVDVDITNLGLGRTIKVADVDFGDLNITTSKSRGVAAIEIPRAAKEAMAAAKKAEKEGGKKK
ncbi:MAG: 50S ribosomal protein L25 [Bacteroidia bacterium]|nr:50S ribosomal protein L25 [Bacteroidia bacterium]